MALTYFINRRTTTCVISLKGSLSVNDVGLLEQCLKEATVEQAKYIIINMGGVKDVEPDMSRPFTLFQQGLRGKGRLFLCDVQPEPEKLLKRVGVLRENECVPDLMTCLQLILNEEKG